MNDDGLHDEGGVGVGSGRVTHSAEINANCGYDRIRIISFRDPNGVRHEMSCPNCGLETLPEQKFCRSCGTSLQVITQPIAERAAVSQIDKTTSKDEMQRANRFVLWGLIIMFIGAAYGVIGKMLIHENTVTVVGVLVALAGMFLTVYPYLLPSRRKQSDMPAQPERLTQSQPKTLHESRVDYLPSITERTTNLLNNAARPKDKDSGALSR